MRVMFFTKILVILTLFAADATYAAGSGSLWGDIDAPAPETPVILRTVCDVLGEKASLGNDALNSSKVQASLKDMLPLVKPEYAMFLTDPAAMKDLYKQFREQYLQQNCNTDTPAKK